MEEENEEKESLLIRGGKGTLKGGLWGLEKYGQGVDWANDQVNLRTLQRSVTPWLQIPGASEAVEKYEPEWVSNIMDYSYKDLRDDVSSGVGWVAEKVTGSETAGNVAEFGSQVLLPDITDVKTGGIPVGAIPRVAKKLRKIDFKTADRVIQEAFSRANSIFNKGNLNWRLAGANNVPVDDLNKTVFFSKTNQASGGGGNWSLSKNPVQNKVLLDRLESNSLRRWLIGNTNKLSKKDANLIQEIASSEDFMSIMRPKFDALKKKYPGLVKKIGEKESLLLRWHHVNPSKGGIDLYKGLVNPADRMDLNRYLIDELGIYSGNNPLNNRGLSIDVHDQIHEWLGKRLGLRADVLKHKWAKELGIDVGELSPGKGFMADHLVLSKEGRKAWDDYFSKLNVNQRKPFFKEYGELIKESDGILDDLMKQFDALYAMPEGFQAVIPDEVLIEFLDNIPTDGSRLLQKDIRAIVEQVANDMPRGTLNIIDKAGDIKVLDLKVHKRIQEVRQLLDEAKDLRTQRSLKDELKKLEQGVYQEAIDFKGLEKRGVYQKRLEQEKIRREGKKKRK